MIQCNRTDFTFYLALFWVLPKLELELLKTPGSAGMLACPLAGVKIGVRRIGSQGWLRLFSRENAVFINPSIHRGERILSGDDSRGPKVARPFSKGEAGAFPSSVVP
jgi:hypothetical protein